MSDVGISPEAVEREARRIEKKPWSAKGTRKQNLADAALLRALRTELTATQEKLAAAEARVAHLELLEAGHRENAADDIADFKAQIAAARNEGLEMASQECDFICRDFSAQRQRSGLTKIDHAGLAGAASAAEDCKLAINKLKSTPPAPVRDDADRLARDMALIHYLNDSFNWVREDETTPKTYAEILAAFNAQDNSNE